MAPSREVGLAPIFKALGDPTRLRILDLLRTRGQSCCDLVGRSERGLCSCDVETVVGLSQAAVSHHLAILKRVGLVHAEKRGRWMFFSRNEGAIAQIAEMLSKAV